jgi:acyl-CoA thioester hydrolase
VGIFKEGNDIPAVVGGYTHVFVDSTTRKSMALSPEISMGLSKIFVPTPKL